MMLSRRAFLGLALPSDEDAFVDGGMRIAGNITDTTPLRAGDLVVSIAGAPVRDLCELGEALRRAGGLPTIEIEYERDGASASCTVDVVELPREPGVEFGELVVDGVHLRTLINRALQPRGVVLLLQGIACESIEQPTFATLARGLARSRDVVRYDKRGVGDSDGGSCKSLDFATELADARAMFERYSADARSRGLPLAVLGHSVGGIIAALLPARAATIVYGTPVMRWLTCLHDSARRQLAEHGELSGRSATYHAQLDSIDIESAWRAHDEPVLVLRGEHDWVVDAADQGRVSMLARGRVDVLDLPGLDHLLGRHRDRDASIAHYGDGAVDEAAAEASASWLDRVT